MRILILGATGGLGQALARQLQGQGELLLVGRRPQVLRDLAQELGGSSLRGDLSDELEASALLEQAGPVDLLFHAVGVAGRAPARETGRQLLEAMLSAHFLSAANVLKYARFGQGARAVFFGAYPAYVRVPGFGAYAAAKAALEAYLEVARKELRKDGVRLILVRLPAVATPLWTPLGGPPRGALAPEEAARKVLEAVLGDAGDEVAL
ncbi:SDR family NAD(P)-dependent oxidoreductase [Limisphaera ngatamarikiensis]|uniref:SDR family NAD(P)-dependent oxidoreductase n=1 Tax=Limisphaera ngatamarikiensis TaxID=1324935 RepID=A0A6M1RG74_9BACT|nr:SDR family NAD(P)-dependent oxidoreductase [Limisphaera ngatamarikiensis]NGO39058.1 SDR family NAD(P)-dependent oxidoreductase [Limisphaera ngatamarikiensis]